VDIALGGVEMPKTKDQAVESAKIGKSLTRVDFCVIADPDCEGLFMDFPLDRYDGEIDPPIVFTTRPRLVRLRDANAFDLDESDLHADDPEPYSDPYEDHGVRRSDFC
jgi:hypothetical protein